MALCNRSSTLPLVRDRDQNIYSIPYTRTEWFKRSCIPFPISLRNSVGQYLKEMKVQSTFKFNNNIKKNCFLPSSLFCICRQVLISSVCKKKNRNKFSSLNLHPVSNQQTLSVAVATGRSTPRTFYFSLKQLYRPRVELFLRGSSYIIFHGYGGGFFRWFFPYVLNIKSNADWGIEFRAITAFLCIKFCVYLWSDNAYMGYEKKLPGNTSVNFH